jgi:hypothetical protein
MPQAPHHPQHTGFDQSTALTHFLQGQSQRWTELGLSHQNIAATTLKEKMLQINQAKDPYQAQLLLMQACTEQMSNAIQFASHLWSSSFEAHSQWNQFVTQWMRAQQGLTDEGFKMQWLASQPSTHFADTMAQSVLSMGRHFINGIEAPRQQKS